MIEWVKRMFGISGRSKEEQRQDLRDLREMAIAANEQSIRNSIKGIRTSGREMETMRGMLRMMTTDEAEGNAD